MTSFSFLCYFFFPLLLLVTTLVVLRRNRGMKSARCSICEQFNCGQNPNLLSSRKKVTTTTEEEEEYAQKNQA